MKLKQSPLLWVEPWADWVGYPAGSSEKVDGHPAYWNEREDDPRNPFEKGVCRRDGLFPQGFEKAF
jgi:hypothetical protein